MYESCIKRLLDLILSLAAVWCWRSQWELLPCGSKKIRRDRCSLSSAGLPRQKML